MTLNVPDELLTTLIKQQINKKQTGLTEINWDTKTAAKRTGIKEDRVKAIFRNML